MLAQGTLDLDIPANGPTIWENVADAPCWNREVIRPFAEPV